MQFIRRQTLLARERTLLNPCRKKEGRESLSCGGIGQGVMFVHSEKNGQTELARQMKRKSPSFYRDEVCNFVFSETEELKCA
jgi:hypothetical protein